MTTYVVTGETDGMDAVPWFTTENMHEAIRYLCSQLAAGYGLEDWEELHYEADAAEYITREMQAVATWARLTLISGAPCFRFGHRESQIFGGRDYCGPDWFGAIVQY